MSLAKHIEDVRFGIKSGRYCNEASVSQGIVLRLLQALEWPTYDTQVVCPEFSLGQSDGAERQLFEYAFHVGVPLAILTDGQEWNFFLPAEQGDYSERRVYKLDMVERDVAESVSRMERYLSYAQVSSGAAINAAREDYKNVSRSRQMLSTLPEAWSKLVSEEDELLLELLADKVESLCGFKPDVDTVARFLRENVRLRGSQELVPPPPRATSPAPPSPAPTRVVKAIAPHADPKPVSVGYTLDGRFTPCRNGREVLVAVFEALAKRDPTFLERFAARPKHGRTRRYLARSPEELYPGRADLAREHSFRLQAGWYIGTNVSHAQIERIIEMACEVSRIRFGTELVVNVSE